MWFLPKKLNQWLFCKKGHKMGRYETAEGYPLWYECFNCNATDVELKFTSKDYERLSKYKWKY